MGDAMNIAEPMKSSHDYLKQMHRWRMAFFGLVILLAGIVIGVSSMFMISHQRKPPPPPPPEVAADRVLNRQKGRLRLSGEQMKQLGPIFEKHMDKLDEIRITAREQITERLQLMNEDVSSVLDERQKQLWERDLQDLGRELRPARRRDGFGPHGPPPDEWGRHRRGQQERMRRGPGSFGPRRDTPGPNRPWNGMHRRAIKENGNSPNEDL